MLTYRLGFGVLLPESLPVVPEVLPVLEVPLELLPEAPMPDELLPDEPMPAPEAPMPEELPPALVQVLDTFLTRVTLIV